MPDQEKPVTPALAPEPVVKPAPISAVPAAVPATIFGKAAELPEDAPANTPKFAPVTHPVLFAIHGKKHLISSLKEMITADANLQDPYKALLHHELGFVKTEAAEIDLHVVKHENGDVSFQGHIKRIALG